MRKLSLIVMGLILCSTAYAEDRSKIEVRASANDEQTTLMDTGLIVKTFQSSIRQQNTLSCDANTNTSLTIPRGSKAVLIDVGTNRSLHLIGGAGDKGISLDSTCPILLPLSSDGSTTIRISNDLSTSATIKAYFF